MYEEGEQEVGQDSQEISDRDLERNPVVISYQLTWGQSFRLDGS